MLKGCICCSCDAAGGRLNAGEAFGSKHAEDD